MGAEVERACDFLFGLAVAAESRLRTRLYSGAGAGGCRALSSRRITSAFLSA